MPKPKTTPFPRTVRIDGQEMNLSQYDKRYLAELYQQAKAREDRANVEARIIQFYIDDMDAKLFRSKVA